MSLHIFSCGEEKIRADISIFVTTLQVKIQIPAKNSDLMTQTGFALVSAQKFLHLFRSGEIIMFITEIRTTQPAVNI